MHNDPLTVGVLCGRYFNDLQAEVKCKAHETCRAMVSCQQEVVTNTNSIFHLVRFLLIKQCAELVVTQMIHTVIYCD